MTAQLKTLLRSCLPRTPKPHHILSGQLRGSCIVTSWHDYPAAIVGYAEKELTSWLIRNVAPGETWLDVGAHYGYTSISMCKRTGTRGRVFAFEPSLSSAGCLSRTRLANRLWWWTICPFGLDESPVFASHELPLVRGMIDSQVASEAADGTEQFLSVALDSVWPGLSDNNQNVHGIKIDVQGMEIQVLKGMREVLRAYRPKLVLEIHADVDRATVIAILVAAGYDPCPKPIERGSTDFFDVRSNFSFVFQAKAE